MRALRRFAHNDDVTQCGQLIGSISVYYVRKPLHDYKDTLEEGSKNFDLLAGFLKGQLQPFFSVH